MKDDENKSSAAGFTVVRGFGFHTSASDSCKQLQIPNKGSRKIKSYKHQSPSVSIRTQTRHRKTTGLHTHMYRMQTLENTIYKAAQN